MSNFKVQNPNDKGERWKAKVKVEVERGEAEGEMSNVKAQMPKGKIQMTNA